MSSSPTGDDTTSSKSSVNDHNIGKDDHHKIDSESISSPAYSEAIQDTGYINIKDVLLPQAFPCSTNDSSNYMTMSGTSDLAIDTMQADGRTNFGRDSTLTDSTSKLAPGTKPIDELSNLAPGPKSTDGTSKLAPDTQSIDVTTNVTPDESLFLLTPQPVDPYDVIDEDKLEKIPKRWTVPQPQIPTSARPNRNKVNSESYQYHGKKFKPLRMVDATISDTSLDIPSSKRNRQVLLTGIHEKVSIKDIGLTFKTEILTRSDDLEDVKLDRVHREAIVTLKTSRAADDLLDRMKDDEKVMLKDFEVNISKYDQSPIDPYKLIVLEPDKSIKDVLFNIRDTFGLRSSRVIKGENHTVALLCFDSPVPQDETLGQPPDFNTGKWNVLPVERTKRVRVKGVTMETKPEDLEDYFNQLSRDGSIKSTVYRETQGDYIITFSTFEDAEKVLAKHVYQFEGADIEVTEYYPILDGDEEYIINKPDSKKMLNMDKVICWYLKTSKQYRKDLEDIVSSDHGKIRWPGEEIGSLAYMEIVCDVDEEDRNGLTKIQKWKENSAMSVAKFCQKLSVQYGYFALEIEKDLNTKIQNMQVECPEKFCVKFEKNRVIIAGETTKVDLLNETIQNMIGKMETDLGRSLTKIMKLEKYMCDMFVKFHFDEQLKGVCSKIDDKQNIVLKGRKECVDNAISKIKDLPRQFVDKNIKDVGVLECSLLRDKHTRTYIEERIKESGVIAILRCSEQDELYIHCRTTDDINTAEKDLKSAFKRTIITLNKHDQAYLQGDGVKHLHNLEMEHRGRFMFQLQRDALYIVTLDILHQEVIGKVKNFLDLHSYIEDVLVVENGVFLYIFNNRKGDVKQIIQQYDELGVEIDIVDRKTRKGFMVKGTKERCKLAFAQLHKIVDNIIRTDKVVTDDEFHAFLQSPEGIEKLGNIQLAEKCVVQIPSKTYIEQSEKSILAKLQIGSCDIEIMEGDITEQEVDYIVNPTDPTLEHKRGLGRTLVDKGGFAVQKSCNTKRSCIKEFDSFVGKAGNLPCRGIIHVVLPQYSNERNNAEQDIDHAVRQCLSQADKVKANSIAFPMIGTGRFGYPNDVIVKYMIEAMKRYLLENGTNMFLKHILVCDIEQDFTILLPTAVRNEVTYTTENLYKKERLRSKRSHSIDGNNKRIYRENVTESITLQDTDVIVNSTNKDLNLRIGGLSKTIVNEGGADILDELSKNYPNGILPGVIAVTTGGKLKCKAIFHGVLEKWDQNQGHAETVMRNFIFECLLMATKKNYESISFPVLGSGALQFPSDLVTKIMSTEVDDFERKHPKTSLKIIRIVKVKDSNEETVPAEGMKNIYRDMDKPSLTSIVHRRHSRNISNIFSVCNSTKCYSTKVGNVTLSIEQGDLTTTVAAVIVNSVPESLNLKSGIISKAILNAAGDTIETEAKKQMATFKETQLVMTGSGKMISCQKIIHIKAKSSSNGWKRVIVKCLAEIEKCSYSSIAFPALGTGVKNFSPVDMGRIMAEAFKEYIHGDNYRGCLKDIKIVLFNPEMEEEFTKVVKSTLESKRRPKSIFDRFWHKDEDEVDSAKMVIHIFTETHDEARNVVQILDEIQEKNAIIKKSLYNV